MKATIKLLLTSLLCAALVLVGAGANTVCAAEKKSPLKVGFDGTTVNLIKDLNTSTGRDDTPKLKTLKKKWGKPDQDKSDGITTYTWKKGKSSIEVTDYDVEKGGVGSITIEIKDKNASLCGVTTGMKKSTALKKLQKALGKEYVVALKEGQSVGYDEKKGYFAEGKATGDTESIMAYAGPYMPIEISLKKGKISSISWWRS